MEHRELVWTNVKSVASGRKSKSNTWKSSVTCPTSTPLHPGSADLYLRLRECKEQQAVFFYFGHIRPRLQYYWTDDLAKVYAKAGSSSTLAKVVSALACSITSQHPRYTHFRPLAIRKYTECLHLVAKAVNNPSTKTTDETLTAVVLLGAYEVSLDPVAIL